MATKVFQLILCIFLFLLALSLPSRARPSKPKAENPTSFDFIKHLEGCQKGQTVNGLQQLKKYLEAFGYLNYSPNETSANGDNFDDSLEVAVKTYQLNFHLKTTGTLDAETVSQMAAPRCGVLTSLMALTGCEQAKKETNHEHKTLHTVSHYAFFPNKPKWLPTKYQLTYAFAPGTSSDAIFAVAKAFSTWASQTQFRFSQSQNFASVDLKIGFYRGDHGDGKPFYGRNGVLAHAFSPYGKFHYNGDELFTVNPVADSYLLETVAMHEIGHLLGLAHSDVEEAIMWPYIPPATIKGLNDDDIQGIKTLYA